MEQNKPLVVCSGLTKSYGSFTALKNLDLNLERGRFIGLLGPNGSGKTTTIKLLNGLLQPTSGMITVDGAQPGRYTHSIVSYLPDRAYLSDWMKVMDVIDFFSDFYRDFDRVKAIEMFKTLRISPLDRLKTLSKGTKEKVQLILTMSRRAQPCARRADRRRRPGRARLHLKHHSRKLQRGRFGPALDPSDR